MFVIKHATIRKLINAVINETKYGYDSFEDLEDALVKKVTAMLESDGYKTESVRHAYVELDEQEMWSAKEKLVREYAYSNYDVSIGDHPTDKMMSVVWIYGFDVAGFTLEAIIDRLASGLVVAKEHK